jgi:hypothetical protein
MAAPYTAGEVAMLPRVIQMVVGIVGAGVMAYPLSAPIDVGSIGMSLFLAEVAVFLGRMRSGYFRRTVLRDILMAAAHLRPATAAMCVVLCQG